METLRVRMYPGIRTSARGYAHWLAQNTPHCCFQGILHGNTFLLALPATVGSTIIRTGKQDTSHSL